MGSWELHNIHLNVTRKARVVFEGVRGKDPSTGGFSLDDINLSSTKCPQHIWHIRNIAGLLATTPAGEKLYSPRFLSPAGYSFQVNKMPPQHPMDLPTLKESKARPDCCAQMWLLSSDWAIGRTSHRSALCRWACTLTEKATVRDTWPPTST